MEKDRELLFGVLAVQLKLVSPQQLMESAAAWATRQDKPLSEVLVVHGLLSLEKKKLIEELLELQVKEHAGNIQSTLQSFGGDRAVYESFAGSILVEKDAIKLSYQGSPDLGQKPVSEALDDDTRLTIEQPGRYSIKGEHDRGGIGRIMIAFDETVGREIAVKELLPQTGGSGKPALDSPMRKTGAALARFLREARITGQLEHPGIVPVYEIGKKSDGSIYYTMKLIRGSNFSAKLKEYKNLQERLRLLPNFLSLCQAVAYAHSRGVIHRDIKPANVLIGEFGETVLLDWGLAKVKGLEDIRASQITESLRLIKEGGVGITSAGLPVGTPAYMSPEQAEGTIEAIDERSDVWCLGAFLYEIVTGCLPFTGTNCYEVTDKIINDPIVPIREVEPKAPAELCAIAEKCLQKSPRDRYQSAAELAKDLTNFQAGGLVGAFEYPVWKLLFRWLKGHWIKLVLATAGTIAGLLLIICLGFTVFFNFQKKAAFPKQDMEFFSISMEKSRMEKLLIKLPDGPGNAATDLMKANHNNIDEGKKRGSLIPYQWIEQVQSGYYSSSLQFNDPKEMAKLVEWSKIPEVDLFKNAASRGSYQMWGVEIFPRVGDHFWNIPIPYYLDFERLAWLGIVRAMELEKQGRMRRRWPGTMT